jgi:hypothetical protein
MWLRTHVLADLHNLCGQGTVHKGNSTTNFTGKEVIVFHRLAARSALSTGILTARGPRKLNAKS